ncbi:MAG: response regulator transcription factor, partial [Bacteroidota bacterium]
MNTLNAIIVDDELRARHYLRQLIEKFTPALKIAGEASNADEAKEAIAVCKPDLVFLDIDMPGKTGVELLREFDTIPFRVIFTTAYDKYAVEAFRLGAVDYLLKPVDPDELMEAFNRATSNLNSNQDQNAKYDLIKQNYQPDKPFTKITIPTITGFEFVDMNDILYMKGDNNYTRIKLTNGKQIMASRLLGDFEKMLEPYHFFR